jgi:hypothetical protein
VGRPYRHGLMLSSVPLTAVHEGAGSLSRFRLAIGYGLLSSSLSTEIYRSVPVDASVVAAAERLDLTQVETPDRGHFSVVGPRTLRPLTFYRDEQRHPNTAAPTSRDRVIDRRQGDARSVAFGGGSRLLNDALDQDPRGSKRR